jgi:hypothetical protein
LTPDPVEMEADLAGRVYRVSHVVDGEFVILLRRRHATTTNLDHYDFATRSLRAFASTCSAKGLEHFQRQNDKKSS